ncbi:hypothetical protein [Nocardia sp. NPDC057440]|uniref:hypothetical protein n=1 Tax=Nocardia sp. NPDC057440 TaxID=3346134 RepID=UPI00366DC4A1
MRVINERTAIPESEQRVLDWMRTWTGHRIIVGLAIPGCAIPESGRTGNARATDLVVITPQAVVVIGAKAAVPVAATGGLPVRADGRPSTFEDDLIQVRDDSSLFDQMTNAVSRLKELVRERHVDAHVDGLMVVVPPEEADITSTVESRQDEFPVVLGSTPGQLRAWFIRTANRRLIWSAEDVHALLGDLHMSDLVTCEDLVAEGFPSQTRPHADPSGVPSPSAPDSDRSPTAPLPAIAATSSGSERSAELDDPPDDDQPVPVSDQSESPQAATLLRVRPEESEQVTRFGPPVRPLGDQSSHRSLSTRVDHRRTDEVSDDAGAALVSHSGASATAASCTDTQLVAEAPGAWSTAEGRRAPDSSGRQRGAPAVVPPPWITPDTDREPSGRSSFLDGQPPLIEPDSEVEPPSPSTFRADHRVSSTVSDRDADPPLSYRASTPYPADENEVDAGDVEAPEPAGPQSSFTGQWSSWIDADTDADGYDDDDYEPDYDDDYDDMPSRPVSAQPPPENWLPPQTTPRLLPGRTKPVVNERRLRMPSLRPALPIRQLFPAQATGPVQFNRHLPQQLQFNRHLPQQLAAVAVIVGAFAALWFLAAACSSSHQNAVVPPQPTPTTEAAVPAEPVAETAEPAPMLVPPLCFPYPPEC